MNALDRRLAQLPPCSDNRHCFAKLRSRCLILSTSYDDEVRPCPFCKEFRDDKRREEENTQELLPD